MSYRFLRSLLLLVILLIFAAPEGCREIPTFNGSYEVTFISERDASQALGTYTLNLSQNELQLSGNIRYGGDISLQESGQGEVHQKGVQSPQTFSLLTQSAPQGDSQTKSATEFQGTGKELTEDASIDSLEGHYTFYMIYYEKMVIDPEKQIFDLEERQEVIDRGTFTATRK